MSGAEAMAAAPFRTAIWRGTVVAGERRVNCFGVGGDQRPLDLRLDLRSHSPGGFAWGYGGSGPAQLALAILADHMPDNMAAVLGTYQDFKARFLAGLDGDSGWGLSAEVLDTKLAEIWQHHGKPSFARRWAWPGR